MKRVGSEAWSVLHTYPLLITHRFIRRMFSERVYTVAPLVAIDVYYWCVASRDPYISLSATNN